MKLHRILEYGIRKYGFVDFLSYLQWGIISPTTFKRRRIVMKRVFVYLLALITCVMPVFAHATTEGRVTYDFEPSSEELAPLKSYVSEYASIDVELAAKVLFSDEQYQTEDYYIEDAFISTNCTSDNAEMSVYKNGSLDYSTNSIKYTSEILTYDTLEYYQTDNLAFMTSDDAASLCESTLAEIGISSEVYLIASYDVNAIKELSDESKADLLEWQAIGKEVFIRDDWSTDDEFYYIKLYQIIDGIPVSDVGYYDSRINMSLSCPYISAIVTRNGIEYIDSGSLIQPTSDSKDVSPCTQKVALDAYIADKNSVLQGADIHLMDMYMRYVPAFIPGQNPNESFNIVPSWTLLRTFDQNENGVINTYFMEIYCDIETGKELGK